MFFNMFSFGIYIVTQQIILMPIMARILPEGDFANIVVYISIFAIISNVLGSELGITRQINEDKENNSNYNRILVILIPIISIISVISLKLLNYNCVDIILLTIPVILANIRLYSAAYFRLNKNFKKVLLQNIIYLIGTIIGLILFYFLGFVWLPMLVAEAFVLLYDFITTDIIKEGFKKTINIKKVWKSFIGLAFISLLVNGITYFDKILIYPILGEMAVTIYYSTNSMSKVISLITNPLHGVILSWLKGGDINLKNKLIKLILKINIPLIIIIFILSIPLTYLSLKILYPQYIIEATSLIIPTCIALSFSTVATLIKSILLKYVENKELIKIYLAYFIIFVILAIIMSNIFGLLGFVYSNIIAKFILWLSFIILLKKTI